MGLEIRLQDTRRSIELQPNWRLSSGKALIGYVQYDKSSMKKIYYKTAITVAISVMRRQAEFRTEERHIVAKMVSTS